MISLRKNNGQILLFICAIVLLLTLIILQVYSSMIYMNLSSAIKNADSMRAYYLADAGLADGLIKLRNNPPATYPYYFTNTYSVGTNTGSASISLSVGGSDQYTITSKGSYKNASVSLALYLRAVTVTAWGLIIDSYSPWLKVGTFSGPYHTNNYLSIWDAPVFLGPVTQSAGGIRYYNGGPPNDNPVFSAGITFGVPTINLPGTSDFNTIIAGAWTLEDSTSVTINLKSNGKMDVTCAASPGNNLSDASLPLSGVVYVISPKTIVHGTLNGQLTIAAQNNIYIDGHIYYHDKADTPNFQTVYSGNDLLGLVANGVMPDVGQDGGIIISQNAPIDLKINGFLLSTNGGFTYEYAGRFTAGNDKGHLRVFGGQSQYRMGDVCEVVNGDYRGYSSATLNYDPRLTHNPPPAFPYIKDNAGRIMYVRDGKGFIKQ